MPSVVGLHGLAKLPLNYFEHLSWATNRGGMIMQVLCTGIMTEMKPCSLLVYWAKHEVVPGEYVPGGGGINACPGEFAGKTYTCPG